MRRVASLALSVAFLVAACGGGSPSNVAPPPPTVSTAEVIARIDAADRPVVLNVWASWCIPCRSEAPLLSRAAKEFSGEIEFLALNVRDSQPKASSFIAEFFSNAPIEHIADPEGAVPVDLGGTRGVPLTFFYRADGTLATIHPGVIDERTLALQIDELLATP